MSSRAIAPSKQSSLVMSSRNIAPSIQSTFFPRDGTIPHPSSTADRSVRPTLTNSFSVFSEQDENDDEFVPDTPPSVADDDVSTSLLHQGSHTYQKRETKQVRKQREADELSKKRQLAEKAEKERRVASLNTISPNPSLNSASQLVESELLGSQPDSLTGTAPFSAATTVAPTFSVADTLCAVSPLSVSPTVITPCPTTPSANADASPPNTNASEAPASQPHSSTPPPPPHVQLLTPHSASPLGVGNSDDDTRASPAPTTSPPSPSAQSVAPSLPHLPSPARQSSLSPSRFPSGTDSPSLFTKKVVTRALAFHKEQPENVSLDKTPASMTKLQQRQQLEQQQQQHQEFLQQQQLVRSQQQQQRLQQQILSSEHGGRSQRKQQQQSSALVQLPQPQSQAFQSQKTPLENVTGKKHKFSPTAKEFEVSPTKRTFRSSQASPTPPNL